jgi:alpha-L-rhamnosidase
LQWIDGVVPTPDGDISVYCSTRQIKVKSDSGTGTLRFQSLSKPTCNTGTIKETNNQTYELTIEKGVEYEVKYESKLTIQ